MAKRLSEEYWASGNPNQADTKSDAIAWGRIAARLGWGLDRLEEEVTSQFHDVARQAYETRSQKLQQQKSA